MDAIEQTVHIIPLGHEIDRAIAPFEKAKADKVYLLTSFGEQCILGEEQDYYTQEVIKKLEGLGIIVECVETDIFDLLDIICNTAIIIRKEKDLGNRVNVNMSAAGRLTSVGVTLAAMAHNVNVYYVKSDAYPEEHEKRLAHGLSICSSCNIFRLVNFQFLLPDEIGIQILVGLCNKKKPVYNRDILGILQEANLPGFEALYDEFSREKRRAVQSRQLMRLDKTILTRLEKDGFIEREKQGRNVIVSLTETGLYAACASGLYQNKKL
ncbi:MAG: DUF6293 family protein [Methanomicrobium sp.]|jgi:hypothetical protein|nr:DUF6293 family protein [Methanomicrobium sp.]